ncbi:universal stress protein [Streptomyces sp. NPDC059003]|uniref:universal stress protein n=1 Tax=Streptomyces sp. NPDC059003 TaxID=3346691 RepID=UPI00367D9FC1
MSDVSDVGDVRGDRVVVGISGADDDLADLAALRAGEREARRGGRTLVAVIAWEPPEGEGLYLRHPDKEWARHWQGVARERLERAFEEAFGGVPEGVAVERRVVRGRAGRALVSLASRPGDLIVLGGRPGRPGRRRGRVRRYVDRRARCGVLVVPAPVVPRGLRRALRGVSVGDFGALAGAPQTRPFPNLGGSAP